MSELIDNLLNEHLIALKPYESARRLFSGGQDWLNANESPFANDYTMDDSHFNRYPDCQPPAVIDGYARYTGLATEQIITTRGADEGIELLIRTFCTPGKDSVLICPPTYGMYAISAETCNVGIKKVPLNNDFSLDVDGICGKHDVNLVFICSPNNPTGTRVDQADLIKVLEHFADKALVVVDEAYIEFDIDTTWASQLAKYPNLVILRTLSKAFALAGIRCGFTLANQPVIAALMKVIAPYPVPEPVAQIAAQALSENGIEKLNTQVANIADERAQLAVALDKIDGITLVGDTKANFILFNYEHSKALMAFLVDNGMLIRDQSKQLNLDNCLRVSIGNADQNARLLDLITQFIAKTGN